MLLSLNCDLNGTIFSLTNFSNSLSSSVGGPCGVWPGPSNSLISIPPKLSKNVTYVGNVDTKKFSQLINSSHLSLNILRDQNDHSHNMKTFEIPAMGGLMITKRTKEQKYFFPENKACLMYHDLNELKTKIRKVLKNPKKFHKVSKKAYKLSYIIFIPRFNIYILILILIL